MNDDLGCGIGEEALKAIFKYLVRIIIVLILAIIIWIVV